jgi:hypothetical protein
MGGTMEVEKSGPGGKWPTYEPLGSPVSHLQLTSQTLNDEINAQDLEITSLAQQNAALRADNANLVQRWLDKMNLTAEEMNDEFEKERNGVLLSRDGSKTVNEGNGEDFHNGGKAWRVALPARFGSTERRRSGTWWMTRGI